jgi:hypothetical protein
MTELHEIVYVSAPHPELEEEDVADVLAAWRIDNARRGVTGVLLRTRGAFIHALEGPTEAVVQAFARIAASSHHRLVSVARRKTIRTRRFGAWSVGYKDLTDVEDADLDGLASVIRAGGLATDGKAAAQALGALARFEATRFREPIPMPVGTNGAQRAA